MPRWDYDTVCYRVFCITLLGIAFTFTVILTNVFVDIDGLLFRNNKANKNNLEKVRVEVDAVTDFKREGIYDYRDYDSYDEERRKRSLENQDLTLHIPDPNIKKVITNRLAELLEDLDKKTSKTNDKNKKDDNKGFDTNEDINIEVNSKNNINFKKDVEVIDDKKSKDYLDDIEVLDAIERIKMEKDKKAKLNEEDIKHLAIHDVILQGIIRHMDLGDVYSRVQVLINNLENFKEHNDKLKSILHPVYEKKFFNELVNCKQLKEDILAATAKQEITTEKENIKPTSKPTGRNVMIKTIIDITSLTNDKTNQDNANSKENVNGIIKLIYNGKSLKFRRVDDGTTIKPMAARETNKRSANLRVENIETINDAEDKILNTAKNQDTNTYVPKIFMNKIISEYLKRISKESDVVENFKFTTKRQKRNIKIKYENDETTNNLTQKPSLNKKNDDELFLEIETHFNSKGLTGEKKKKMIRDLIEKISKAIHSEKEEKNKKRKHLHVKKRMQNPLDRERTNVMIKTPLYKLVHRESDPISKYLPMHEVLPYLSDEGGDLWRRDYYGPKFLNHKGINSAEMGELDTDYKKVLRNGIPERLQKPLNNDNIDEISNNNNVPEAPNSKYVVKNIPGSGFSIGFNQFVDEAPDAESINLFTGIENIIKTYHQNYDESRDTVNSENEIQEKLTNQEYQTNDEDATKQEHTESDTDVHSIVRRSIKNIRDYHSNEYKIIFNKNFLNFDNYQDVYNDKKHSQMIKNSKDKNTKPFIIDDNVFNKELKPSEIFRLADLLKRRKRSLIVKKISNIKNYKKLNRYLNTKSMASKNIFRKNKRSKRQIDKIRIIAKDISNRRQDNPRQGSGEDIFVFSDEKIFADRAVVKEVETPDIEVNDGNNEEHLNIVDAQKPLEEHFDIQKDSQGHYDIFSPVIIDRPIDANDIFSKKSRHNALMSKYPHLFLEEISRSKEVDYMPNSQVMFENGVQKNPVRIEVTPQDTPTEEESHNQYIPESQYNIVPESTYANDVKEMINLYPKDKTKYKVTVKIMPKNSTGVNSGFKETHTSINKSYNKNGLMYTSLVNVSEISKIEKLNKTNESEDGRQKLLTTVHKITADKIHKQHTNMKSLIQQHKNRIEEQLAHLMREKEKLDSMDIKHSEILKEIPTEYIDVTLPTNPVQTIQITEDELAKLNDIGEIKRATMIERPLERIVTTTIPTTTTTEYVQPTTEDTEKIKIMNTIERNENITNEILNKINTNTNILQTFLEKLMKKIDAPTHETSEKVEFKYPDTYNAYNYKEKELNNPNHGRRTQEMYEQLPHMLFNNMPKEAHRNGSAGIPFVYAFQHPYMTPDSKNKNMPIASVVYQGHIHTNTLNKRDNIYQNTQDRKIWREKDVNKEKWTTDIKANNNINSFDNDKNSTKFFIDDIENDFKVLPLEKTVYPGDVANRTSV